MHVNGTALCADYLRNKRTMDNFNKEQFAKDMVLKRVLEKRISLRKAAAECDVHFSNLSRYERQEVEPTITHMLNICNWLGNDISKYLKTDNKETVQQQSNDKTFAIPDISQQRELLLAFADFLREEKGTEFISTPWVDKFLKANNCS